MAVITYRHTCDLCGKPAQPDQLARLYSKPAFRFGFAAGENPRIDVCARCQARPISDALGFLARNR